MCLSGRGLRESQRRRRRPEPGPLAGTSKKCSTRPGWPRTPASPALTVVDSESDGPGLKFSLPDPAGGEIYIMYNTLNYFVYYFVQYWVYFVQLAHISRYAALK
jgi:hypothetical protein